MVYYKQFDNGLKLVVKKIEGLFSVSAGVFVKTGSANESEKENGISHYIEHVMFKGTKKRSAFEISDHIDRMGSSINAYTSKGITCYYTKSIKEHYKESMEVLSDIFFDSVFDKNELEKEKGVVIEEINMSEDDPEELLLDMLAQSYYGKSGLGQTILGPSKNVKSFTREDVLNYIDKYYTADNVVISLAGNVDFKEAESVVEELFASRFTRIKSGPQVPFEKENISNLYKSKQIEQTHLGFAIKSLPMGHELTDSLSIANSIFGGGMSSRLFQKVREELGLAYSVYSYISQYQGTGVLEIYAGVNTALRDMAVDAIVKETIKFKEQGITQAEFSRGKEQMKSAFIMGQEVVSSQMMLFGRYLLLRDEIFDFDKKILEIEKITIDNVMQAISLSFDIESGATATVGAKRTPIKIN